MRDPPATSPETGEPASAALDAFFEFVRLRTLNAAPPFAEFCAARPEQADQLRELMAAWERSAHTLSKEVQSRPRSGEDAQSELMQRLQRRPPSLDRYEVLSEIGRGGMGQVVLAWDGDLRRRIAMKTLLRRGAPGAERTPDAKLVHRFLEEAQITGQLDHPGIVPVHELGLDPAGALFFTMRLVEGDDLRTIFDKAWSERDGWNQTRVVSVLHKVCEAMAYAHSKGVLHRDLKPANVMVGPFGEVYVMDWGLARARGHADLHDARGRTSAAASVRTERREHAENEPDSSLVTLEGDVLGTPCYMPPEQARGRIESVTARSDVYAVGAMLYHLLARQRPYGSEGDAAPAGEVLLRVVEGPPAAILQLRPQATPELVAICERAMARDSEQRYASMLELADDLRAWLEGRVVRAYESGVAAELRKWVRRNRKLALAIGAAALVFALGVVATLWVQTVERRAAEREAATRSEVLGHFIQMFEGARPESARKSDITVREVLERSASSIPEKMPNDPVGRALLMHEMARVYKSLELHDAARELLEETLAVRREALGPDHALTQDTLVGLGHLHLMNGDPRRAQQCFEQTLEIRERTLGLDHPETWKARNNLAAASEMCGDDARAEKLFLETIEAQRAALGPQAQATVLTLNNLAVFYTRRGRAEDARRALQVVAQAHTHNSGARATETLVALESLASAELAAGMPEAALARLREVHAARVARDDADHPETLATATRLGTMLCELGELEQAELLLRPTHEALARVLGNQSTTRAATAQLVRVLQQRGAVEEARQLALELLAATPADDPRLAQHRELVEGLK